MDFASQRSRATLYKCFGLLFAQKIYPSCCAQGALCVVFLCSKFFLSTTSIDVCMVMKSPERILSLPLTIFLFVPNLAQFLLVRLILSPTFIAFWVHRGVVISPPIPFPPFRGLFRLEPYIAHSVCFDLIALYNIRYKHPTDCVFGLMCVATFEVDIGTDTCDLAFQTAWVEYI